MAVRKYNTVQHHTSIDRDRLIDKIDRYVCTMVSVFCIVFVYKIHWNFIYISLSRNGNGKRNQSNWRIQWHIRLGHSQETSIKILPCDNKIVFEMLPNDKIIAHNNALLFHFEIYCLLSFISITDRIAITKKERKSKRDIERAKIKKSMFFFIFVFVLLSVTVCLGVCVSVCTLHHS